MTYTITKNAQFDSLEIVFDSKPSDAVRDALKSLRFRWHSVKKCWYGYTDEGTVRAAIEGTQTESAKPKTEAPANRYGVRVGDIFSASWGYEQTNNDFFQVVALVGETSVRVREVYLPLIEAQAVSGMSENRIFEITREMLPAADHSVFIKDQERGDIKRLRSHAADGVSEPLFTLSSFCTAHYCSGDKIKVYESWYA